MLFALRCCVTCKSFQAQTTKTGGSATGATSPVAGFGGLMTGPSAPATQPPDGEELLGVFCTKLYQVFKVECFTIFYKGFYGERKHFQVRLSFLMKQSR